VLPWKLLKTDIITVKKEEGFIEQYEEKINQTVDIIRDIRTTSASLDIVADSFDRHFPNNTITKKYRDEKPISIDLIKEFCSF
jgi:hypothetical protein